MKITTAAEMRTIDRVTVERHGVHSLGLMENAGSAVAMFAREYWPHAERVTIVCGKGNNGGDGLVAARKLHQAGRVVEVLLLADPKDLAADAANMFGRLPIRPVVIRREAELQAELTRSLGNADLIIDAILGTGFNAPVEGIFGAAIQVINATSAPVLAVDIPSGANADAYTAEAFLRCRADAIITFTAPRPAHIFAQLTRGPIVVAQIGSPAEAVVSALNLEVVSALDVSSLLAPRALDGNKGRYGHVLVIGGSVGKSGAAAMAAMGALRAGAGLVTVAAPKSTVPTIASFAPELMTEPLAETHAGTLSLDALKSEQFAHVLTGKSVIALGPGLSRNPESAQFARELLKRSEVPVVLDADGLNAFEEHRGELRGGNRALIVTPHPGEMSRLTAKSIADVQADRLTTARQFAKEHGCTVVLKGYRTVIALQSGLAYVNPTGNAGMATGGTGDILTGFIAGMLAQFPNELERAVCGAVFLHGMAGDCARDALSEQSLIATDLLRYMPEAMRRTERWAAVRLLRLQ